MVVTAGAAAWVRVQVWVPTVTVELRVVVIGFAAQVTVSVALPVPESGLTTAHVCELEALQVVLEVTAIDAVEFAA